MRRRLARLAVFGALALALGADCVASDRPIVLSYDGTIYWLPNLVDYDELGALRGDALRDRMTTDDWALWPPVRHDPVEVRTGGVIEPLAAPSPSHHLGTDDRGRDVAARFVHGARTAVTVGGWAALLSVALALALALLATGRRRARAAVMTTCDAVSAVPAIVVVVAAQGLIGAGGLGVVIVFIAIPRAADTARIAVAGIEQALASDYCAAARALGASPARVLLRHALPHALPQVAVAAALTAATAVLAEAALGYLGFGAAPPAASWGELLRQAQDGGFPWWLVVPPGLAIAVLAGALGALAQPRPERR